MSVQVTVPIIGPFTFVENKTHERHERNAGSLLWI